MAKISTAKLKEISEFSIRLENDNFTPTSNFSLDSSRSEVLWILENQSNVNER